MAALAARGEEVTRPVIALPAPLAVLGLAVQLAVVLPLLQHWPQSSAEQVCKVAAPPQPWVLTPLQRPHGLYDQGPAAACRMVALRGPPLPRQM